MFFRERRKLPVIIWDVGGVILNFNPNQFAKDYFDGQYEIACQSIFEKNNWAKFDRGDLGYKELIDLNKKNLGLDEKTIDSILQAQFHSLAPKWEVIQLIKQLYTCGYEQYCLSNGSREYLDYVTSEKYRKFYDFSLHDLFDDEQIVLSANIKIAKPEREIYQYTQDKFRLKTEIIFFDDNLNNVQGALDAGWNGKHFKNIETCKHELSLLIELDPDAVSLNDLVNSEFGRASNTAKMHHNKNR
jgi:putative hydrolase of the HAD superfamily